MSFTTTLLSVILTSLLLVVKGQGPIEYVPEFLEELENHTVSQGRDVSFTCVVNHLGNYKVAWIKSDSKTILAIHTHLIAHNSRMSVTHNGHNTWKLKVSNVQKNDSGTYMCQINTDPMKSQVGSLEVVIPPDVLNEEGGDDHVTTEGGSVRLRCRATGSPEPKVMWKREDSKNIVLRHESGTKEEVRTFEGELLELTNIQRTEMGSYLCIASNGIPPSVSKRIIVQVHFHPIVKVPNQLVGAPAGSDVIIQCYVETSPKAMHSWLKETGEKLMDNSKYIMEEVIVNDYTLLMNLTIKRLEKKDFGSYVCQSVNALGKAEGTIRLQELHIIKTTSAPIVNIPEGRGRKKNKDKSSQHLHGPPPPLPQPVPTSDMPRRRKPQIGVNDDDLSQMQVFVASSTRSPRHGHFSNTLSPQPTRTTHAKGNHPYFQSGCLRPREGWKLVFSAVLIAAAII